MLHRPSARLFMVVALLSACTADNPLAPTETPTPGLSFVEGSAPQVLITEIMADPTKVADAQGEWFEVFNAGADPVDLNGWRIVSGPTGSETHVIASSILVPSGGFAVIGNNTNSGTNGGVVEQYSYGGVIALNNSNTDWLVLKLPDGTVIDSVSYSARSGATIVAPTYTPTAGASRVMLDAAVDNTLMGGPNWANTPTSVTYGLGDRGTPGSGPYTTTAPPGPVVIVTVMPDPATATLGGTRSFGAIGRDSAGRTSPSGYTWTSSDTTIARIDVATGVATGTGLGSATITATSANGVSGTASLTVSPPVIGTITIAINTPRQAPVGYVKPAFPTVRDAGGVVISPAPALTWSSSDTAIAEVDPLGYITAKVVGVVTIRATAANGVFGTSSFTVIPPTAPTSAIYGDHLAFGTPVDATPGDEAVLTKPQYTLGFNDTRGGPAWVSWTLDGSQFGAAPRCDCFSPDLTLPTGLVRVVDLDYRNSGYDRGHMVQSESRTTTDQENATTFLLTNILPQAGENNQGPWGKFENFLNDLARTGGKDIWVVAGGEYAAIPGTLKGEGKVQIPDYTWKVAVILPSGASPAAVDDITDLQVIAIRMPNLVGGSGPASATGIRELPWQNFETSVDAIEAATGFDVLSALPDPLEAIVEARDRYPVASLSGPGSGSEGSALGFDATGSTDPDDDALTFAWTFGDGATSTDAAPAHTYAENGSYVAMVVVSDPFGAADTATTTVSVGNVAPALAAAFANGVLPVTATVPLSISWSDPGTLDTHTATIDWGDGTVETGGVSGGSADFGHAYTSAGFYQVAVTLSDDDGGTASATSGELVLVARAEGFVTGGGFVGEKNRKSHFTVEARYHGLDATPEGRFDWRGNAGLDFQATEFDWMVVDGERAVLHGIGTLAGVGTVTFELSVSDSERGGRNDGIGLRLYGAEGALVYDSGAGTGHWATAPIQGGNLTVH
jgi:DNA/RNA endonuclease G (NUC1)